MQIVVDKSKQIPIYMQIRQQLVSFIEQNNLPPGAGLPNVKKVASLAGVSTRTADQAFQALIDEGRCFRRPKKGTFVAKKNNLERKKICGLLGSHIMRSPQSNILTAELYNGISSDARERDIDASMIFGDIEKTMQLYETSAGFDFLGVAIIDLSRINEAIRLAEKYPGKKFVIINHSVAGMEETPDNVYSIMNDDCGGGRKMAEYYIARGCKSAATLNYQLKSPDETYNERIRGYVHAIREYGLNYDAVDELLISRTGGSSRDELLQAAYLETKKYLSGGNRPEVILVVNDFLAEGVEKCIEDEKLTSQIQVAGYDCLVHEFAVKRRFNSVRVNYAEMGRAGVELLSADGRGFSKVTRVMPELDIAERSS